MHEQIVSRGAAGSVRELYARADHALMEGRFDVARDALETVTAAWRSGSTDARQELEPSATYDLAMAYEGLGKRSSARDTYLDVERRFGSDGLARSARTRLYSVHAYLEEWDLLAAAAERGLAVPDIEPADRMAALAARGLARVEKGDLDAGSRDIQDGLDLMESLRIGSGGRLPTAAAMLRFGLGEVRRARSEKTRFAVEGATQTTKADLAAFMPKMEIRCEGLMGAQESYLDAMRAADPYFIAFGAYRIGEMYESLHRDLMAIPPTYKAKSEDQQSLFFAMMHVRYRVLLEKARDMMVRTMSLAPQEASNAAAPQRDPDFSVWLKRATVSKEGIDRSIDDEKRLIASLDYDEATVRKAIDIMKAKFDKATAARENAKHPAEPHASR